MIIVTKGIISKTTNDPKTLLSKYKSFKSQELDMLELATDPEQNSCENTGQKCNGNL